MADITAVLIAMPSRTSSVGTDMETVKVTMSSLLLAEGVACVDEGVACVDEDVACVDEGVACVDEGVACVDEDVACVDEGVACVDEDVACVGSAESHPASLYDSILTGQSLLIVRFVPLTSMVSPLWTHCEISPTILVLFACSVP